MKVKWSKSWISSIQPRKQRKYVHNAPSHVRRKIMSSNLSKDLRKKYGKRSLPVREGDKVKVLRGQFNGTIGEVEEVNRSKYRVYVKGAEINRGEAQKIRYPIDPSNLVILELNLSDKRRAQVLERK